VTLRSLLLWGLLAAAALPACAQTAPDPALPLLSSADAAEGERVAVVCRQCHSFDKAGAAMQGPPLWNLVGGGYAAAEGFAYSPAFAALKAKKWDYEGLSRFLMAPGQAVPGTTMTFFGVKRPKDRADLIAFLRSRADSPAPLP
jgi:cytochrome c